MGKGPKEVRCDARELGTAKRTHGSVVSAWQQCGEGKGGDGVRSVSRRFPHVDRALASAADPALQVAQLGFTSRRRKYLFVPLSLRIVKKSNKNANAPMYSQKSRRHRCILKSPDRISHTYQVGPLAPPHRRLTDTTVDYYLLLLPTTVNCDY